MSTLVQIKRSTANVAPGTLLEGELAYSYVSNVIFIGDTANGVMNIGGKYYTDLVDNASAANGATTLVRRYANGSIQLAQADVLVAPTANSHIATKEYVDLAVTGNVTLADLNDVSIGAAFSDQNNKILVGNTAGYYVGVDVTGNVSLSNTGVFTIGADQVTNAMLVNDDLTVTAGNGLAGGGLVALGGSITLDVVAGDGISNTGDSVNVDSTVVRTDRNQTLNGFMTFSNTVTINADLDITGNIFLNGNTTYINVSTLNISDPLIYLAANNDLTDLVDIGFMGGKNTAGVYSHTGLVRDASTGVWHLFDGLPDEGHEGNVVDFANTTYALLRANVDAQSANIDALTVDTSLLVTGSANIINGDLTVLSGNIHADGTANLFNMTTSVINLGDVATTVNIGAGTGNTVIKNNLVASKNVSVTENLVVGENSEANVFISNRTVTQGPSLSNFDGERLRLYDFDQAGRPNYAIGVEGGHIWMGIDGSANNLGWKWYGNTSQAMRLSGNGVLEVANTIIVPDIYVTNDLDVTGSLTLGTPLAVSSGGLGLSSLTANGVFFGNTTSSVGFATGTDGQVLQISAGVPTFAMLDGGSF